MEETKTEGQFSSKLIKWASAAALSIFTLGTGSLPFVGEALYRSAMDSVVADLKTTYQIMPIPDNALQMMLEAEILKMTIDSTLTYYENFIIYQQGFNAIVINTCETVTMDGYVFYNDTCNQAFWIMQESAWGPFLYQAVKQGRDWYYFPFQWQIAEGDPNRLRITK